MRRLDHDYCRCVIIKLEGKTDMDYLTQVRSKVEALIAKDKGATTKELIEIADLLHDQAEDAARNRSQGGGAVINKPASASETQSVQTTERPWNASTPNADRDANIEAAQDQQEAARSDPAGKPTAEQAGKSDK